MNNFFEYQKTIGVVGSGPDADNFISKANALGYLTVQLNDNEDLLASSQADKKIIGSLSDFQIREEFLMLADLLVYFDYSIRPADLEEAQKSVVVPQGTDLLAIGQDRSLQKAFYESIGVNIAPYETIVKEEDIKNALPSIGYPAVLRSNVIQEDEPRNSFFIYEEEDIKEASNLLEYGPCVLESWIISEHQLSITVVKSSSDEIQFYPIIKKHYKDEKLSKTSQFKSTDTELVEEIQKATKIIVSNISFLGVITVDFMISPSKALYLGRLHPFPNELSRYTEASKIYSSLEAHLRSVASIPLANLEAEKVDFVYFPLYGDQLAGIEKLMLENPKAIFNLYSQIRNSHYEWDDAEEIGYFLVENEE